MWLGRKIHKTRGQPEHVPFNWSGFNFAVVFWEGVGVVLYVCDAKWFVQRKT